mmetsp:Transcript_17953/g.63019  ORF Transcript_17953/g.63019 Transcript_17953/m.63019 type:complete len:592 (+) Transcript_17953:160-1935(+)
MVKRALCIGCNYPSKKYGLSGAVNDAFLIADCLQRSCGFQPEDICVLHDMLPGQQAKSSERLVESAKRPTRSNILQRLQWLTRGARPGDVLFFSFAGYGLQVDDVDGYQDEGLDEAILPSDFAEGVGSDFSVIVASDIHDALMSVPQDCVVTVVMDCDHATSVVDVSGTVDGRLVKGLKLNTTCGFNGHTMKVAPAEHNRGVWLEEPGISAKARPRFQPTLEIANPRKGRVPTRTAMSRSSPQAFCYSAAGHGQTALELQVADIVDGREILQQHGALSWSFVQALEDLRCDCTHSELIQVVQGKIAKLKELHLSRMDQQPLLTFSQPFSDPRRAKVFQPPSELLSGSSSSLAERSRRQSFGSFGDRGGLASFPTIVPPPPPGFLGSGMSQGGSFAASEYASFAQPEDTQSQMASAGLQIWRAAWNQADAGTGEPSDAMNPSDFRAPTDATPAVAALGFAGGVPPVASSSSVRSCGSGGGSRQHSNAAPVRERIPSKIEEASACESPTSSSWEAATREPSMSEMSSSGAESEMGGWEAFAGWATNLLGTLGAPQCGLAAGQVAKRRSPASGGCAGAARAAMALRSDARQAKQ